MELGTLFTPMNITLIILVTSAIFFMQGKIRADLVALGSLMALILFGIINTTEALAGFSNPVVIMMVGLFVVGAGIFRTGLAKMISGRILQIAKGNESLLFVLVILVTGIVGAFVSNTGTVAVMMPIIISLAASTNVSPRRYLMPLAFGSSMGLFTLISTPPNLVIQEVLIKSGYKKLEFFSFAPIGCITLGVGLIVLFFLSKLLVNKKNDSEKKKKKEGKSLQELANEYDLLQKSYKVAIPAHSPVVNKSLAELKLSTTYGISISKVLRVEGNNRFNQKKTEEIAGPNTQLTADASIYCHGQKEDVDRFVADNGLEFKRQSEQGSYGSSQDSGIAEIFIMPKSNLINRTIAESKFRREYNVNILGIKRHNDYEMLDIADMRLHSGDALLIQGTWDDIANLGNRQDDLVLVGQPLEEASKVTFNHKAPIAAGIMVLMIAAMVFNLVPAVVAILLAAGAMVFTGCLRNVEEAYNSINWESIVLIAAMLPMATAFENTQIDKLISNGLIGQLGDMGPYALLAGVYFCTSMLTMFISNTATAVLFAPIAMQAAVGMGVSPYPFLFAVAVAASMCFASPFSTPPNALVMNPGGYTFMDYIKVGLPLQIIMGIVMVISLPFLFPF